MRTNTHARARNQNFATLVMTLFLGLLLVTSASVLRGTRDPIIAKDKLENLGHLLDETAPEETVEAKPSLYDQESAMAPSELLNRWDPMIAEASRRMHVPEKWIRAVMRMESGGRTVLPGDVPITSDAGAVGIMQVMPGTYDEMRQQYGLGDDPFNPRDNIMAGAAYMRWLHGKYGYPALFAAYNDGPGNLDQHLNKGRKLPTETRNYIARIARILGIGASGTEAMAKFTRPDGTPVWIDSTKVSGLRAVLPGEFDGSVQSVLNIGATRQAICEDIATAAALLRQHGGNV